MSENKSGADYIFEKTQELKRIKNKKALNKKLLIISILVFFVLLIVLYFNSDYSKIKYININGIDLISENEVIEKLNLKEGEYKLFVNKRKIKEKLFDITLVKDSIINVDINGNLNIYIDEKRPLMYWINDNKIKVLFDDKSIYEIEGTIGFKWLVNIPLVINISEENILNVLYDSFILLDKSIVNNIVKIESYPLSYDDKNVILYFNDDNYVLCTMSRVNKANDYYQILTKLKINNSCIFFDEYSNNGYSSICPWEIESEENIESNDIIEEKE